MKSFGESTENEDDSMVTVLLDAGSVGTTGEGSHTDRTTAAGVVAADDTASHATVKTISDRISTMIEGPRHLESMFPALQQRIIIFFA